MIGRFICNLLNGQHIIHKIRHVQTVHVAFLHQCIKNKRPPAAVLSWATRLASSSSSSNRPSQRSKLLNDYHNKRIANLQLANLGKDVVEFALDPQGSRFIEQKLRRANPTEKAQLVDALRGHVLTLALHKSGSHVIQAALKSVDKASQIEIINEISAQVLILSLHEYGSWVIECLLEHCTEQQKRPVLEQLHGNVPTLVTDQYGSFVIEHLIEHGLPEDREPIVRSLQGGIMKYAQDKFASLVILKCLICGTAEQKKALFDNVCGGGPKTLRNARQLMADEFGSHVIEAFFEYGTEDQKARLVDALRGHVLKLSLQIYGAPVIQTALKSVDKASQMKILEELTPRSCVIKCIKDHYGSHVINRLFEFIEPQRLQFIVDAILSSPSDSVASLSLHEYGSRVIECVLEHCTEQQKRPVLEQLHGNGSKLFNNYNNARAANLQLTDLCKHIVEFAQNRRCSMFIEQKLRRANPTEKAQLVDALRGHVLTLALHKSGSHVIEAALKSVDKASQIEIINEISAQVLILSLHEYGCWVIQCLLEHCTEQQKRPVLEQLHGNVLSLVTDQYGSFVIQHLIEHGLPEDRERIVRRLQGGIMKYAQDKFASLVIRKCLICGTPVQKKALFDNVCGGGPKTLQNARQLMADEFGTFVIQKFFEYGTDDQKARLVDALRGQVLTLAQQIYSYHVILIALKSVDKASQIEIINELSAQVIPLSLHEYGTWVIQCVLEHCTEQQKRAVLEQLLGNVLSLVTDKYGSFVIQYLLEHGLPEDRERIVRSLQGKILKNTHLHSFCSVIEKCVVFGTPEQRNALIDQVCADNGSGFAPLLKMMKHPFGNDVVQKMLNVADTARHQKMMLAIKTVPIKNTGNRSSKSLKQKGGGAVADKKKKKPNNGLWRNSPSVLFLFCSDLENRTGTGTEQEQNRSICPLFALRPIGQHTNNNLFLRRRNDNRSPVQLFISSNGHPSPRAFGQGLGRRSTAGVVFSREFGEKFIGIDRSELCAVAWKKCRSDLSQTAQLRGVQTKKATNVVTDQRPNLLPTNYLPAAGLWPWKVLMINIGPEESKKR
uniref:PUM-HD domain-containing protein n=1 Tax=Globodera rostochiensis TaxID=31243 RepID=A0A914I0Q5_GLORO